MTSSLTILDATMPDGSRSSLRIVDGVVVGLVDRQVDGDVVLDAAGRLLLPAFVEPHAHLDKAFLAEQVPNPTGDLMGAILAMEAHAGRITHDDIVERAERAARLYAANGTTLIRSHVDVTEFTGVRSVEALADVRRRVAGLIDLELVALCGWPITGPEGQRQRELLLAAVEAGADVVGGCPHLDERSEASIEVFLEMADRAGLPVDLHTDEHLDASRTTLPALVERIRVTGFKGAVTASHCVSLGLRAPDEQRRIAEDLADAGVGVVTLPATNLFLQGRDHLQAMPRGLTALPALRAAGVDVAAGWDNLQDPFNPLGRADPLEVAGLMILAGHHLPVDALASVTTAARRVLRRPETGPTPGAVADLVLVAAADVRSAISSAPADRVVVRGGRIVA
ncbi:MAG: amidohydrolase family protein [Ilumatobacteraceae bacterium]